MPLTHWPVGKHTNKLATAKATPLRNGRFCARVGTLTRCSSPLQETLLSVPEPTAMRLPTRWLTWTTRNPGSVAPGPQVTRTGTMIAVDPNCRPAIGSDPAGQPPGLHQAARPLQVLGLPLAA